MLKDNQQYNIASGSTQDILTSSTYINNPQSNYYIRLVIANNTALDKCTISLYNADGDGVVECYYARNIIIPNGVSLIITDDFYIPSGKIVVKSESGAIDVNVQIVRE